MTHSESHTCVTELCCLSLRKCHACDQHVSFSTLFSVSWDQKRRLNHFRGVTWYVWTPHASWGQFWYGTSGKMNSFGTYLCQCPHLPAPSLMTPTWPVALALTPWGHYSYVANKEWQLARGGLTQWCQIQHSKTKAWKDGRQKNSRDGFGGGGSVNHAECIWLVKLPSDYQLAFTRHFYGHLIPVKQPPPGQTKLLSKKKWSSSWKPRGMHAHWDATCTYKHV